jgi:hypothetical protein
LPPDKSRFPSGFKALGDYMHERGVRFGIYSDVGSLTCSNFEGSWDHFETDARTYADWGEQPFSNDLVMLRASYLQICQAWTIL